MLRSANKLGVEPVTACRATQAAKGVLFKGGGGDRAIEGLEGEGSRFPSGSTEADGRTRLWRRRYIERPDQASEYSKSREAGP